MNIRNTKKLRNTSSYISFNN